MQMSFGSLEVAQRLGSGSTLMKVQQLIDWSLVRKELAKRAALHPAPTPLTKNLLSR